MAAKHLAPLIVIVGETCSGKSKLAIEIAQKFSGQIICADSRTIYSGMDIGTAKPTKEDQAKVLHSMLDIIKPDDKYSAAEFKEDATELIEETWWRDKLPIMVGGTGLYIDSVIFNYQFEASDAPRDPENPRHLLKINNREKLSTNLQQLRQNTLVLGIKIDKSKLEQNITERVEHMLENGLIDEAKALSKKYGWEIEPLKGIGYKSVRKFIDGQLSLKELKEQVIREHMQYAKRQRTWFKRNKYIHWVNNKTEAFTLVKTFLSQSEH